MDFVAAEIILLFGKCDLVSWQVGVLLAHIYLTWEYLVGRRAFRELSSVALS